MSNTKSDFVADVYDSAGEHVAVVTDERVIAEFEGQGWEVERRD